MSLCNLSRLILKSIDLVPNFVEAKQKWNSINYTVHLSEEPFIFLAT